MTLMSDNHPGNGLTVSQLLYSLREQLVSIIRNKPPDLTLEKAREFEEGISDILVHAKCLVNSFHVTVRVPPEILTMICSHLNTEEDIYSASQVCNHWRSVLISSPPLWIQSPCRRVPRTIASLERCKSLPIRLMLASQSSIIALKKVLLRGNKVISLAVHPYLHPMPLSHQLFTHSRPTVEQLHVFADRWRAEEPAAREIWQDFPCLRELFVCRYSIPIDHLVAPNLVHLALEQEGCNPTLKSTLNMLRACPLLETLLIVRSSGYADQARNHSPVSLPHLRSIEFGLHEVNSGLVTHVQLPLNVATSFRELFTSDICGEITSSVMVSMQHVLRRVDIRCITLAAPPSPQQHVYLLVRFEGSGGSLEITIGIRPVQLQDVLFGPGGVLFSHAPNIRNARELHIVGCSFEDDQGLDHVSAAMPNLVSISLFDCRGMLGLLTPTDPSSLPFPHLERVMVLGPGLGLREMVEARRDFCVSLKTLVIGRGPKGSWYDYLGDYPESALEEFVDNLHNEYPTEIVEWGADNEIANVWSAVEIPGLYVLTAVRKLFKFCRFNFSE